MIYKAKNIDTDKALEYLEELVRNRFNKESMERTKIAKYYEGYRDGLYSAINDIFYCSNYEKKEAKDE